MSFFVALLVILGLFHAAFAIVAFVFSLFYVTVADNKSVFSHLLLLFPFALVFKLSPGASSLFTFIELYAVIIMFVKRRSINVKVLMPLMVLLALLFLSASSMLEILKLFLIVALYYLFTTVYELEDTERYLLFFVCGLLLSTGVGFFKEEIPRLLSFYSDLNYEWINGVYTIRFSGIYNDPNYYSIALVQPLILFALFLVKKKTKKRVPMLIVGLILIVFGMLTYSKSFYLILAVIFLLFMMTDLRKNIAPLILISILAILVVIWNPKGIFDGIIYRFLAGDITTGRVAIWLEYWKVIRSSWRNTLIGAGLGAPYIVKAAHNIYVEAVYYIGFIGLIVYTVVMYCVSTHRKSYTKKCLLNYIGYICLALQYAFLCGVTGYDITFYLMMSYMIYNYDWRSKVNERELLK